MRTDVEPRAAAPADASTGPAFRGWVTVIPAWIASQLLSGAALLFARSAPFFSDKLHFSAFTLRWDGGYYLGIASSGYGPVNVRFPRWAFFPGLPAVIRGLGDLGLDERIAIHVIDQLALLVALIGVRHLALRRGSPQAASLAVWSLALFPAAFAFSMTYPSALFLAASVWAFVWVEHARDRWDLGAGTLAAGTTLLHPTGFGVALALVVAVRTPRRAALVLAPAVIALAAWCAWCQHRVGDPFVWLTTKSRWQEITALDALTGELKLSLLPHVPLAAAAVAAVVLQRRRLPLSWLALTALLILPALATGMVGMARYSVECFPPFVAAGQLLERSAPRLRGLVLLAGAGGLVVFAFVVARYQLVP